MRDEGQASKPVRIIREFQTPPVRPEVLVGRDPLLNWASRAVLLAVLLAAPWLFGGTEFSHQIWLYTGVLVATALWFVGFALRSPINEPSRAFVPTMFVPIIAALMLGALQLVPELPRSWPGLEHPGGGTAARPDIDPQLGRLPADIAQELASRRQFSLYPASTRLELVRLTVGAAAFLLGVVLFQKQQHQQLLWGLMALNGAALSFFGIVQKLSWNGNIYWTYPLTLGGSPFASFINRNNCAGYLNLCLGAALGLIASLFMAVPGATGRAEPQPPLPRRTRRKPGRIRIFQDQHITSILLAILILAGVCCSLSRGGIVAGGIASLAALLLLAYHRGPAVSLAVGFAGGLLAGALVYWSGLSDPFADRIATVFDQKIKGEGRLTIWSDAWRAFHDFPVLGTGLGSFRYAYQPYQTHPYTAWFYNADNQFVEGLVEGGCAGAGLIGACIVLWLLTLWSLVRKQASIPPVAYVGLFAIVSQVVQSGTDFGITVPSNLILFATISGVAVTEAARRAGPQSPSLAVCLPVWKPQLVVGVLAIGLMTIAGLGLVEVAAAAEAKAARSGLPPLTGPDALDDARLEAVITRMERAASRRPDDVELRQSLADLWIYRYRQKTYQVWQSSWSRNQDASPPPNWGATGLILLHKLANSSFRAAEFKALDELRRFQTVRDNLPSARRHLLAGQAACPFWPRGDLPLAMLAFLDDDQPAGTRQIERAVSLSPADPLVLYNSGKLADQSARFDLTTVFWRRSLAVGTPFESEIVQTVLEKLPLAEAVEKVLPASAPLLLKLAQTKYSESGSATERALLIEQAEKALQDNRSGLPAAETAYCRAVAARLDGRNEMAIPLYQEAIRLVPDNVSWRGELIEAYRDAGRLDDAVQEAKRCVWMAPDDAQVSQRYKALLRQQLTRPSSDAPPAKATD